MPIREEKLQQFFYYIKERESIRKLKESGAKRPWTEDRILDQYKFTNVHRINDRTTKYFKSVYDKYAPKSTPGVTLLNCATFRYVGTIEFVRELVWLDKWDVHRFTDAVYTVRNNGDKPFTGAYVITNGGVLGPKEDYVGGVLQEFSVSAERIAAAMIKAKSWAEGAKLMSQIHGFGGTGFMVKEILQDFLLTCHAKGIEDSKTWTPVGPGARRGINRMTGDDIDFNPPFQEKYWLGKVLEIRERAKEFTTILLTAHDVQFCLCEFDKYCRAREGGHLRRRYKETK